MTVVSGSRDWLEKVCPNGDTYVLISTNGVPTPGSYISLISSLLFTSEGLGSEGLLMSNDSW